MVALSKYMRRCDYFMVAIYCFKFPFDFIVPNIMTEQKGKRYQGIPAIEAFEYQKEKSDIKCCADGKKWKKKKKKPGYS